MTKRKNSIREDHTHKYSSASNIEEVHVDLPQHRQIDGGWAWAVLFATFWCHVIIGGLQHTSGMVRNALQKSIREENLHYIPWLGSMYIGLISLAGPLSSFMVYKLGCRATVLIGVILETVGFVSSYFVRNEKMLLLTYSILAGSGSGITYTAVMVVIGYNFDKYLALASGVSVTGQGVGLLLFSIFLNFIFEHHGLKFSYLVMASLSLQKCVFGSLLWPSTLEMANTDRFWHRTIQSHSDETIEAEENKDSNASLLKPYLSILRNSKFVNFIVCLICSSSAEGIVYLILPGYLISQGSSSNEAATILSLIGVCSTLTRPLMGFLANTDEVDIFLLFLAPFAILGVFTLLLPFYVHSLAGRIIYGIFFGLYNCSVYSLLNKLTVRITGIDHLAAAFGFEMFIWGMAGILGTPLADIIIRWSGSSSSAFFLAGSMYIISAFVAFCLPMNLDRVIIETK